MSSVKKQAKKRRQEERRNSRPNFQPQQGRGPRKRPAGTGPTSVVDISKYQKKLKVNIETRNQSQERLLQCLQSSSVDIVFATGPAGTGKTYLATLYAIKEFKEGRARKIVIARPNVAVDDRDIGHLPGGIYDKMAPWVRPVLDIFEEYYTPEEVQELLEENVLEICPIAFIRGRTFKDAVIIIDEAQGTTPNSLKSILTRIGEGSKMVITGDVMQSDIGDGNGLSDFMRKYEQATNYTDRIKVVKFKRHEIERHPVVEHILDFYGDEDPMTGKDDDDNESTENTTDKEFSVLTWESGLQQDK